MNISTHKTKVPARATLTFHTSVEVKERLDKLAISTRRSKSFLANEAVLGYLSSEEAFTAAVEEGLRQIDAGDYISQAQATAYIQSLSSEKVLPVPKPNRA